MIFLLLRIQYNHVILRKLGGFAPRTILRIAEEKRVQKREKKNAGITSFSRYATEEGELRIVRPSGGPRVSPPGKFLEILALLVQIFLKKNP